MPEFLGVDYVNMMRWMPWIIGACVAVLAVALLWGPIMKRNVQRQTFSGMTVQDIEKMRKDGLISEDEYKKIKHKTAERDLDSMRHETDAEREKQILAEAEFNPDAARKLLTPEVLAEAKQRSPIIKPAEPAPAPQPAPIAAKPAAAKPTSDVFNWGDPLSGAGEHAQPKETPAPAVGVTHPAPGKIRIPPPQPAQPIGELEILLQKGAISREDYERLKNLIKK